MSLHCLTLNNDILAFEVNFFNYDYARNYEKRTLQEIDPLLIFGAFCKQRSISFLMGGNFSISLAYLICFPKIFMNFTTTVLLWLINKTYNGSLELQNGGPNNLKSFQYSRGMEMSLRLQGTGLRRRNNFQTATCSSQANSPSKLPVLDLSSKDFQRLQCISINLYLYLKKHPHVLGETLWKLHSLPQYGKTSMKHMSTAVSILSWGDLRVGQFLQLTRSSGMSYWLQHLLSMFQKPGRKDL